ncbi:Damage-regulated import facilitator 1 [Nakaseomyces bracarensis]|uniref:Damage-regulated import facilitator 1 n=1 Tax=Nakaseomyces bracarensis TaxID=273131 RepID=A0ABR4NSX2_9SACH
MDTKRQQTQVGSTTQEQYECQNRLSTVGMRIRQKIDQGYSYTGGNVSSIVEQVPVRDVASTIVPQFRTQVLFEQQRVPMNKPAPMLVNERTESSNLDGFEEEMLSNGKRRMF